MRNRRLPPLDWKVARVIHRLMHTIESEWAARIEQEHLETVRTGLTALVESRERSPGPPPPASPQPKQRATMKREGAPRAKNRSLCDDAFNARRP